MKLKSSIEVVEEEKRVWLKLVDVLNWLKTMDKADLHESMFPIGSCST